MAPPTSEIRGRVPCSAGRDRRALDCAPRLSYKSRARTLGCTEVYGFRRNHPPISAKAPFTWPPESKNAKRCSLLSAQGTGTATRGAKASRMGRQTLANGWPLSYTCRARTLRCAEVCGFCPLTTLKARRRAGRSKVSKGPCMWRVKSFRARQGKSTDCRVSRSVARGSGVTGRRGEPLVGESEPQSVESRQIGLAGEL